MANGDIPRVTVTVTSHAGTVEIEIPCTTNEQSDFIGGLVVDLANAVKNAYGSVQEKPEGSAG